jgi:hypothetical protein
MARSKKRASENDKVRILAQMAGTTVTFDPAPAAGTCGTLDAGKFCTVDISQDTAITANNPILVGHFLEGIQGVGDPSEALEVPTEQFRTSYSFLIPEDYDSQYISLVAHPGGNVLLEGTEVSGQLDPFATNTWVGGRIAVQPGAHTIQCDDGCGIEVYGYSDAVSYDFAGGLDLEQIVVE